MTLPDHFWDWLAEWEQSFKQGQEITAEELSRDHPELLDELKEAIWALKGTAWMTKPVTEENSAPQALPVHPGEEIGEYTILEQVGSGGMGHVFKARHRRMDRVVALKLLPKDLAISTEALQRFQDEVKAAARLSHPNVVTAFDAGEHGGQPFLVMEFIEGTDLQRLVQEKGPLPVDRAVDFVLQVARGLEYAHQQGIVHRDIKPSNLILVTDGTVKVLDLGLAHLGRADDPVEGVAGSVDYLAPEQTTGPHQPDPRTDIYSLGCTLFFLMTGKPIFGGTTVIEKFLAHRESPIPSLREARPEVPQRLDRMFQRMVAKKPEDRFASMAAVIDALQTRRQEDRKRWMWTLPILLCGVVGGTVWWANDGKPPQSVQPAVSTAPVNTAPVVINESRVFDNTTDDVRSLAISPDGSRVLTGSFNTNMVRLWDVATGKELRSFKGHTRKVNGVAFSSEGLLAASAGGDDDRSVRVWNLENGELVQTIEGHEGGVWGVTFTPDGKHILSSSDDKTLRLWNVETGEDVRRFEGHTGPVFSVAISKDGRQALSGGADNTVRLWDIMTGQQVHKFEGHATPVWSVGLSKDGRYAISGDQAGIARIWDLTTGKELHRLLAPTEAVFAVAFSSDGRYALTGGGGGWRPKNPPYVKGEDNSIALWDVATGRLLNRFVGHTHAVWGLAFMSDGTAFISVSRDKTIREWKVPK